ncbi:MAG: TolC family protein [Desulfobacteraceae bacterium]|nr:MAG: TolC family protein [Desulfobacteraceae bacterium]
MSINIKVKNMLSAHLVVLFVSGIIFYPAGAAYSGETPEVFTLEQTIQTALKNNIELQRAKEDINAAAASKNASRANFLPVFTASYQYKHSYEEISSPLLGITTPENDYLFAASITQPLFAGFSIINSYKLAGLGLDAAGLNEKITRLEIIYRANKAYFSVLKALKIEGVLQETVEQRSAHENVAKTFYEVGMTPLNDLLKSQVELANSRQELTIAKNNLEYAKSDFNTLLRRPINASVDLVDILKYAPLTNELDYYLALAQKNRLEIKLAEMQIEMAEKELALAKKDYFPTVTLTGTRYQRGTDWDVDGGDGISDPNSWNISAIASWNIWEWGKTCFGTKEKKSRLLQAKFKKDELADKISLEVKQSFLKTKESENNILTVQKAIEQAKENLRISQERYKEQIATSTDVLDAQTLLSRTMTNYYNALYDFKISKASLYRAISMEPEE